LDQQKPPSCPPIYRNEGNIPYKKKNKGKQRERDSPATGSRSVSKKKRSLQKENKIATARASEQAMLWRPFF